MRLSELPVGQTGRVQSVDCDATGRLQDLGLMEGCEVTCLYTAPAGDPRAYLIKGAAVALRQTDAAKVWVCL